MDLFKSRRPNSILSLALDGRQLEGLVLQRFNGSFKVVQTFQSTLSLDPLTNDSELVGREIRNRLDEAGIREHRCAVCIPLQWALTLQTKVPAIPEADVSAYLQIEAERGFPMAPDDLAMAISRFAPPRGEAQAMLIAVPKGHLTLLEKALRAARLKPSSFTLGITVMQDKKDTGDGLLTLVLGETGVELQVSIKGGVATLRTIEGAYETEGATRRVDAALIAREIRITLGQLPKETRELINRIRVFGRGELVKPLIQDLSPLTREMGLLVDVGVPPQAIGLEQHEFLSSTMAAALGLATRHLTGTPIEFEFLPPRQSPLAQMMARFSSRRVVYAGVAAAVLIVLVGSLFLWQQWDLFRLDSRWRAMKPRVTEVDAIQAKMRKFRSWYDESVPALRIVRRVTEAFPEDGAVTAKILEIRGLSEVSCSGQARDSQALLRLLDRLREAKQITDLKNPQTRGASPIIFNLNFRWSEGVSHD